MSKAILSTLLATLIGVVASTAHAANGISDSTLAEMGLSGLTVMTDSDALAIRGKGYFGGSSNGGGCHFCKPRATKEPWSAAAGNSFANIRLGGECPDCVPNGDAHSENAYAAEGPYAASGENFSEAGAEVSNIEVVVIDGVTKSITTTVKARVFAGGFSSAMSF
jgi:hypothetical protein